MTEEFASKTLDEIRNLHTQVDRLEQRCAEYARDNAKLREALVAINNWTGDCVDDPCAIGSPNPKEIAGDALEP